MVAMHRSPGICLTAEENPRKPQLGEGAMRPVIASNGGPFPPKEVGRISKHVRKEKEIRKG